MATGDPTCPLGGYCYGGCVNGCRRRSSYYFAPIPIIEVDELDRRSRQADKAIKRLRRVGMSEQAKVAVAILLFWLIFGSSLGLLIAIL